MIFSTLTDFRYAASFAFFERDRGISDRWRSLYPTDLPDVRNPKSDQAGDTVTGVVKQLPEEVEWVKAVGWEEAMDLPCRIIAIARLHPASHWRHAQGSG